MQSSQLLPLVVAAVLLLLGAGGGIGRGDNHVMGYVVVPPSMGGARQRQAVVTSSSSLRPHHNHQRQWMTVGRPALINNERTDHHRQRRPQQPLYAGGFEWDDPEEGLGDPGVDNPFKKKDEDAVEEEEDNMKIDPARLLGPRLKGSNLYFVGMMGSGKSAVGDIVARRMGTYNFLDTDTIIESATSTKIPDIFAAEGEEGFRTIESQVLNQVHAFVRCVVSTGGGIVCNLSNWSKLQSGIVVWLNVDPEIIYNRIKGTDRPLLQTDDPLTTLKELLEERQSRYEQADVHIDVTEDMDADDTADAVIRAVHDFIDKNPPAWKGAKAQAQADGLDWVQ